MKRVEAQQVIVYRLMNYELFISLKKSLKVMSHELLALEGWIHDCNEYN